VVWIATEQGLQNVEIAYTGAWRGTVGGEQVQQPLNLEQQENLVSWLNTTYWQPYYDEYDLKAAQAGKGDSALQSYWDRLVADPWTTLFGGSIGQTFPDLLKNDPGLLGTGVTTDQVRDVTGLDIDLGLGNLEESLKNMGESATKFGMMALVGLGLVAVIMFLK